ncbi:MAG: DUF4339 domain-containing protein [Treponema sp.]|jgi:hypothetical protein|nr:DUF4339 domain-containing protein [Treponema sp.]
MYDGYSFYSIDRLVEFGMGMAMAQQMVQTMNQAMRNMPVPGAGNPMQMPPTPERVYYVVLDGKQAGPFSETELTRLIGEKKLSKETKIWYPGLMEWKSAEDIPEILRLVALTPPAIGG